MQLTTHIPHYSEPEERAFLLCPVGTWDATIYSVGTRRLRSSNYPYSIVFALNVCTVNNDGHEEYFKMWQYDAGLPYMINMIMCLKHTYIKKDIKVKVTHEMTPHGMFAHPRILWESLKGHKSDPNFDT